MNNSYEYNVKKSLLNLNFNQQRYFGYFCVSRVIQLYDDIDDFIDISEMNENFKNGEASELIKSIYHQLQGNHTIVELKKMRVLCDDLIIDTDDIYKNTTENVVFKIVAECLYTFLSFLIDKKTDDILDCSSLVIDVINAQISDDLFDLLNDENKFDDEIANLFELEYSIQMQAIELIYANKIMEFNEFINKTTIPKNANDTIDLLRQYGH